MKKKLISVSLSFVMALGCVGCTSTNQNNNNTTTTPATQDTQETKTVEELLALAEVGFKEGEYGSAKKYLVEAYDNKKDAKEPYKIYADLYIVYSLLNKKESAKSIYREILDDLSEEEQKNCLDYMKEVSQKNNLNVTIPSVDKEEKKEDKKEETKKEETKPAVTTQNDVTPPKFTKFPKDIYADIGERFNYNEFFAASDESQFDLIYDDSKINFNAPGDYVLTVTAKDIHGNQTSATSNIHIVDNSFKYGAGIYKLKYEMNLRSSPSTGSGIVGVIPTGYKVYAGQIYKSSDGSYWAILSNGYVCIEDKTGAYMTYDTALQPHVAQFGDLEKFSQACGFNIGAFGFTNVPKGLNVSTTCSAGMIVY